MLESQNCLWHFLEVIFVGDGAPADKTTMYLNAACGSSSGDVHFVHEIRQTQIQPDGTWSLRATLLLPCKLTWKWRADNLWERRGNREDRLSASQAAILSTFSGDEHESKTELWPIICIVSLISLCSNNILLFKIETEALQMGMNFSSPAIFS